MKLAGLICSGVFTFLSFQFRHHFTHFTAGHHFHHLTGLIELFQQSVHFLNVCTATFGNTLAARTVQNSRVAAFFRSHGVDNRFDALEGIVVNVNIFNGFSNTGIMEASSLNEAL